MRYLQAVIFLAFLATIGIFAVQNRNVITVNFLTWNLSQSVAIVTVAVYILGMLSGWTVLTFARWSYPPGLGTTTALNRKQSGLPVRRTREANEVPLPSWDWPDRIEDPYVGTTDAGRRQVPRGTSREFGTP